MLIARQINSTILRNYIILQHINKFVFFIQKSTNIDSIDSFTNELVENKKIKWKNLNSFQAKMKFEDTATTNHTIVKQNLNDNHQSKNQFPNYLKEFIELQSTTISIENLNSLQIEHFIINYLAGNKWSNIFTILQDCIKYDKTLSNTIDLEIIDGLNAEPNDMNNKNFVKYLLERKQNEEFNIGYETQIAKYLWREGYVQHSLKIMTNCYEKCDENTVIEIRKSFKEIVNDTISRKGEAVLLGLIRFGEDVSTKHNDLYVLALVWQTCFRSAWISDNLISMQLFEKHSPLRELIFNKTQIICCSLLYEHNVDAVHRLIQLFLKLNRKIEIKLIFCILFEYHYWRKDTRACSEILKNGIDLDIKLHQSHHEKLLKLLLGNQTVSKTSTKSSQIVTPKFKFMF